MADEHKAKRLEIAHVLFMDIVGYSKLLTEEQSEALQELNQIVRSTEAAREAEAAGALTVLPTGDGMALVFTGSVEEPVECALEISQALRAQPSLPVRMGIHSGPIHHVKDANGRENIAGVGINIAQRVMDCGDAGHILVSKRVADDLAQRRRWQPYIHELGDVEVKHGVVVSLVNLYAETIGNPTPPTRLGKARGSIPGSRVGTRKAISPLARAIFILAVLLLVLAIMSVIFAPAIMRTLDQRRLATLPQPTATAPPSLADTIKSAVAKQITDELQGELSRKKNAAVQPAPTGSAIPEKSIAVLPFDNLSRDPDNAYFCEGVQDEILTRLAKVADLKVISRTSTQRFKSAPSDLREIAKQLGVTNILEGSVQKSNDQVRVNVQLINAMTDAHLWADTYDRKLIDIFAVESEIAKTIAETLQAKLTGSEKTAMSKKPTANPEAYELYLKGRFFWNKRTAADLRRSIDYFNQAIAKDPDYALAYAGLAQAWKLLPAFNGGAPQDCFPQAESAAKKALALDDTSSDAHAALASLKGLNGFDYPGAIAEYERTLQLNPNDATARQWFANDTLANVGQTERELAELKRALELDPLSLIINSNLGWAYIHLGRLDEAIAQLRKTVEMDGAFYYARYTLALALELKGAIPEAIAEYQKTVSITEDAAPLGMIGRLYAAHGRKDEAQKILQQLRQNREQGYIPAYYLALVYLGLGDRTQALDWLEQGYREHDGFNIGPIRIDPLLAQLHGDPRFEALAEKIVPAREFGKAQK
jgi:TolB-like protein/class 3 adenylate cyclase/Tfp pilus assembly protein PilF